jgi:hypothetical protein
MVSRGFGPVFSCSPPSKLVKLLLRSIWRDGIDGFGWAWRLTSTVSGLSLKSSPLSLSAPLDSPTCSLSSFYNWLTNTPTRGPAKMLNGSKFQQFLLHSFLSVSFFIWAPVTPGGFHSTALSSCLLIAHRPHPSPPPDWELSNRRANHHHPITQCVHRVGVRKKTQYNFWRLYSKVATGFPIFN